MNEYILFKPKQLLWCRWVEDSLSCWRKSSPAPRWVQQTGQVQRTKTMTTAEMTLTMMLTRVTRGRGGRGLNSFFDAGERKVSCLVGERPHLYHVGRHPAQKCHFLSRLDHEVWRWLQEPKLSGESQYKARKNGTMVRDGTGQNMKWKRSDMYKLGSNWISLTDERWNRTWNEKEVKCIKN